MRHPLITTTVLSLVAATATTAQVTFNNNIGAGTAPAGDDSIVGPLDLGFTFTWPDGSTGTTIEVDTNGRVLPGAAIGSPAQNTSAFSESISEFTGVTGSGIPMICPMWDDLTPAGDIHFQTNGTDLAVVTFCNVKKFGTSFPNIFSFQVQLFGNGNIGFAYDERVENEQYLIGVSGGATAPDNGEVDLSTAPAGATSPTVYEDFRASFNRFDLSATGVLFAPNTTGGYDVTVGPAGITACGAERSGLPCPVTLDFFPDGSGGYFVTRSVPEFVDDSLLNPTELATGLGDDANTSPQQIGFPFTFPGGIVESTVVMDNNGRVMSNGTSPSQFSPSTGVLLSGPPTISAFWTDLSSQRGSLRIANGTDALGQFCAITWENVPKFAENATHTFQVVLREGTNSFQLNYRDVSLWRTSSGRTSDDVLIGCSQGGGATDPGEVDFATYPLAAPGEATIYEFWDAGDSAGTQFDTPDIHTMLLPRSDLRIGGSMDVEMIGITSGATTAPLGSANILLGFQNPNLSLTGFGLGLDGCSLLVTPITGAIPLTVDPVMRTATFSLPLSNSPAFVGQTIVMQGANVALGETQLGVLLTNAVQGTIQM